MSNKKSLVEEAIIQMKNLEETVAQNAKGILASTMKKEIKDLVKESIVSEEDDEEIDTNVKMDMDTDSDEDDVEMDMDVDSDEDDTDMDMDVDSDEDEVEMDLDLELPSGEDDMDMDEPIDLTKHSDEEVMKVFKLMGPNDQIIVTKDNSGNINLKDGGNDTEYMLVGENEEENWNQEMSEDDDDDLDNMGMETNESSIEDIINDVFGSDNEMDTSYNSDEMGESEIVYEVEMDEQDEEDDEDNYEIEMDEQDEEGEEYEEDDDDFMSESKMSIKPKGVGMGSPKFKYSSKPNQGQGFKTKMKQGNLKMGTGKPKFEFKEGENLDMEMTEVKPKFKKFETKEASRTYGNGSKSGRGLRKGITPNRNLTFESKTNNEIQILREKNEEYRKALNVFRNKLTEVAVFNSNLAYATRLFTEHTTSKHEKINILRRFDGVESIKESKNLYKSIKDELLNTTNQTMNESIERKIENTPVTGSVNLIESKTYENPQFARMKDLMSKIK